MSTSWLSLDTCLPWRFLGTQQYMAGSAQGTATKRDGKGQPAIRAGFELSSPSVQTMQQNQECFRFLLILDLTPSPNSYPTSSYHPPAQHILLHHQPVFYYHPSAQQYPTQ
jgi:hypothetical protein